MTFRVNPDTIANLLAALEQTRYQEGQAFTQLASGRRVNALSDDPAAAAAAVQNRVQLGEADQFLRNISGVRGELSVAESALNDVVLGLTRAITLGVQGANSTASAADRKIIAEEVRGIKEQLFSVANLSYQDNYIFAGTAVATPPFVADPGEPSGVRYDGNATINSVEVSAGQTVTVGLPGSQVFQQPGADVFEALNNLIVGLETGTTDDVSAATAQLRTAFDHVNHQRLIYGTTLNSLDRADDFLNQEKIELSRREIDLVAADLAATITNLARATDAREAVLAASGRISSLTLLDFLK